MSTSMRPEEKEKLIVNFFLENPFMFIKDMESELGIPRSTIQRYLQKNERLRIPGLGRTIGEQLADNKLSGQVIGGINSFKNNDLIKESDGTFKGSVPTNTIDNKELEKHKHIKSLCSFFLNNPELTLDDMVEWFSDTGMFTRDYIYDCLTNPRVELLLSPEKAKEIKNRLSNRYKTKSLIQKLGLDIDEVINNCDLTDTQKLIVERRLNENITQEELAQELGVTREAISKNEKLALIKINRYLKEKGNIR